MRLGLAIEKNYSSQMKEKIVGRGIESKKLVNLKTQEINWLKSLVCYLPEGKNNWKNLSFLLTGNCTNLVLDIYLIFEQDFISWGGRIKFSSWMQGKCFDEGNRIVLSHQQVVCYVAKILSRYVQQEETGSHNEEKNACRKNPQRQSDPVKNASVCTEEKLTWKWYSMKLIQ